MRGMVCDWEYFFETKMIACGECEVDERAKVSSAL